MQYAFEASDCNLRFVAMLEAENGSWDATLQSYVRKNGQRERSFGLCQIHAGFHPEIVNDPQFQNPRWQVDKCLTMWRGGVKFYGENRANETAKRFKIHES